MSFLVLLIIVFVGAYILSIYTWPTVKVWINGAQVEIKALEDKIAALKSKL